VLDLTVQPEGQFVLGLRPPHIEERHVPLQFLHELIANVPILVDVHVSDLYRAGPDREFGLSQSWITG